jgi:choline-sulfatase
MQKETTMKHTSFILLIFLGVFSPLHESHAAPPDKPNVLLLIVDDLNTWLLEDPTRYSGKVVAPNLQELGKQGIVFRRAYTASPVCCPSRTALLSGVRPWQSGLYENGLDSSGSVALKQATSMPAVFKKIGYYTRTTRSWCS